MKRPDVLYSARIEWVDSVGRDGWSGIEDLSELLDQVPAHAVAQVVIDDKRGLVIIQSTGDAGIVLSPLAIPRAAIVKVEKL